MKSEADKNKFDFLKDLALELGATEAKIIPANEVVVENRVVLKCARAESFGLVLIT
jgi:predicted metal-binding protein